MNKYKEALTWIKNDIERSVSTEIYFRKAHENIGILQELIDKEDKYRWHDLRKDPNDLPYDDNKKYLVCVEYSNRTRDTSVGTLFSGEVMLLPEFGNWIRNRYKIIAWRYIDEFEGE